MQLHVCIHRAGMPKAAITAAEPYIWEWVIGEYLRLVGEYQRTLEKYPNPKAVNMTEFGR